MFAIYFGHWRVSGPVGQTSNTVQLTFVPILKACGAYTGMHNVNLYVLANERETKTVQRLGIDPATLDFSSALALSPSLRGQLDNACGWVHFMPAEPVRLDHLNRRDIVTPLSPKEAAKAILEAEFEESLLRLGVLKFLVDVPSIPAPRI